MASGTKIPFTQLNNKNDDGSNVNILTWVIITASPLQFLVPQNCIVSNDYSTNMLINNINACIEFYNFIKEELLNSGNSVKNGPNYMDMVLYEKYKNQDLLVKIEGIRDSVCNLAKFKNDDGFYYSSNIQLSLWSQILRF